MFRCIMVLGNPGGGFSDISMGLLEELRLLELNAVRDWFTPNTRVLEIGGGSGFQAKVMNSWGPEVISIDLIDSASMESPYYDVQSYNGTQIPAAKHSFDLIFSSNVLEHVKDLSTLFSEMLRVLKPQGVAIHVLPTPAWRFWTSVTHYGYFLKMVGNVQANGSSTNSEVVADKHAVQAPKRGWVRKLSGKMFAGPHGEFPNAVSELYYFSKGRWLKTFSDNGFIVQQVLSTNLYYSGYLLCPNLSMETRQALSRWLGAACRVYITTKAEEQPTR
ncbi:MAG TPA: class I SAM-dependent methyltransferase [Pyrinomonadaceae bacterium]|nr:class I SAM-dependent methyltransferase [Pyrinomonadaceae bacterium]